MEKQSNEFKITLLQNKIDELEAENRSLKSNKSLVDVLSIDSELICRSQINKLRLYSDQRELTLEETRKLEVFHKILTSLLNQNKQESNKPEKKIDSAQLLSLVETINDK